MSEAKFSIGIDLGTTHCALSYVDIANSDGEQVAQEILPIPQLTAPGSVQSPGLLPSFIYLPHASELAPGDLSLPWTAELDYAVGEMARSRGAATPIRLVSSAKSWLCHAGVDRRADILPHDAPPEVARLSPLEASLRYLTHMRAAWDQAHPEAPFVDQEIVVTIPASFDPAARELSAEAARTAGCEHMILLEEPQAALYSWIQKSGGNWRKQVQPGEIILVADVGGGTSDFSLIAVLERDGVLELHRGRGRRAHPARWRQHGPGALAFTVASKLGAQGIKTDAWQLRALTHACRAAKEALLNDASLGEVPLVIASRGAKLIGGSLRSELTRAELTATLLEGFFPDAEIGDRPQVRGRAGLTQLGLPYAHDAAITRHLAAFLARQVAATADLEGFTSALPEGATFLHPTAVLFNGGVFKSELLAERTLATINSWLAAEGAPPARPLEGADLDLAVARGGAYYGYVRRGQGVRIRGGTARSYYVAIESVMPAVPGMQPPVQALCLAPFGMEEGSDAALPEQEFGLVVGEAVRFRFFGSSVRRQDQVGTLLDDWDPDELQELAEIQTTLPAEGHANGEVVRVKLHARVTEAGTLELEALPHDGPQRWKVEFDARDAGGSAVNAAG
jgi:hypothetical protein